MKITKRVKEIKAKRIVRDVMVCLTVNHEPKHLRVNKEGDYFCLHCGQTVIVTPKGDRS